MFPRSFPILHLVRFGIITLVHVDAVIALGLGAEPTAILTVITSALCAIGLAESWWGLQRSWQWVFILLQALLATAFGVVGEGGLYFLLYGIPLAQAVLYWDLGWGLVAALGVAGLSAVPGLVLRGEFWPPAPEQVNYVMGTVAFSMAVALALLREVKQRRRLEQLLTSLADAHRQLRDYADEVEAMVMLRERQRMASDLHDTLGHMLTALIMQMEAAERLAGQDVTAALERIHRSRDLARQGMSEVRRVVRALMPAELDRSSLVQAVDAMTREFCEHTGMAIRLTVSGKEYPLSLTQSSGLFRAAQEALTNAMRHGKAAAAEVLLQYEPARVVLEVADDGAGAEDVQVGVGLATMRQRAAAMGGALEYTTAPGSGFRIRLWVPRHGQQQGGDHGGPSPSAAGR